MAEISGGVYRLPWISTAASPLGPSTTLYGSRLASSWTSLKRRPISRLIEKMVCLGLVTAWRLATWPTSRSPSLVKATTEGVVRPPSALGMTTGSPPSITATTELVVPRSIPMVLEAMSTPEKDRPAMRVPNCQPALVAAPDEQGLYRPKLPFWRISRRKRPSLSTRDLAHDANGGKEIR